MEEALRGHLAGNAALAALVGPRIQWSIREDAPALALHLVDAPPDWHLKGASGLVMARVQGDCWGRTFLEAKAVGDAFQSALPATGQIIAGVKFHGAVPLDTERAPFGESPNQLFRTRIDVRITFSLAI